MAEKNPIREGMFSKGPNGTVMIANRCKSCGHVFFPKVESCLTCFGETLEELPLSQKGKLFAYTVVQMPASHFDPPYAVGYVDLPEGIRIFTPLTILEDKPFQVGMPMELIVDTLWYENDKAIFGYKFSPI